MKERLILSRVQTKDQNLRNSLWYYGDSGSVGQTLSYESLVTHKLKARYNMVVISLEF
jgi:hypothetical protein